MTAENLLRGFIKKYIDIERTPGEKSPRCIFTAYLPTCGIRYTNNTQHVVCWRENDKVS